VFSRGRSLSWLVAGAVLWLAAPGAGPAVTASRTPISTVAVFPVENLSGGAIPAVEVRQAIIERLTSAGVRVLGDDALDAFMARHRVRYGAGIDAETAAWLRQETGADGVVVASVDLSSAAAPAKIGLFARLISVADRPAVIWSDDAGLAGDDAPRLFDLGLVNDLAPLLHRALDDIGTSLTQYLETGRSGLRAAGASKFQPRSVYRNLTLEPGRAYTLAVAPFVNLSSRRNAGEILALHFVRHLSSLSEFRVLDIGVVRRQLLDARIIMDGGLSVSDASTVAAIVGADFVLAGRVLRYEDYDGPAGLTAVEFSTVLIDRASRRTVWSSDSYNEGRDGAGLFERGTSKTAHAMATQMASLATALLAGRSH
jgi:TolB-like protein